MLIDWCDTLHFQLRRDGLITREDVINTSGHPLPEIDLSLRAAMALQTYAKASKNTANLAGWGAHLSLEKRIPSQAGMGGGSSDAATTLLSLNSLWQLGFSLGDLAQIGIQLGADIPFFIYQSHAWVEGIGEKITPIDLPIDLKNRRFLIVKPARGVDTKSVFLHPMLVRNTKTATIEGFAAWTELHAQPQCLSLFGCNNLQPVAESLCPEIEHACKWFVRNGLKPRMTGSGSAVFACVPESFDLNVASSLPADWQFKLCCNTMNL